MTGGLLLAVVVSMVTPQLQDVVNQTNPDQYLPVYAVLKQQVNVHDLYNSVKDLPKAERRQRVISTLKSFARETQAPLLEYLRSIGARNIRSLWIANVIAFEIPAGRVALLQSRSEFKRVDLDEKRNLLLGVRNKTKDKRLSQAPPDATNVNQPPHIREIVWNLYQINAPDVWALGYTGNGVIVAVLDTGVNYNHLDLQDHIWHNTGETPGNGIDDDGNGYIDDYTGWDFAYNDNDPMDGDGHGTHVAGTVAGDGTAGSQTGVAPDATIMCVKVLDDYGGGTESGVWSGIQYAVDNGADVISMSLGWQHAWNPDRSTWRQVFDNVLAAGVVAAVAAGNERSGGDPAPDNVRTPGDVPPPWLHPDQTLTGGLSAVITVGATDSGDQIAYFSSFGPVTWETISPYFDYPYNPEMGLIDPDVSAPGVNIKSLDYSNPSGYVSGWSGTSMATPHVSGTIALMLSKSPSLTPEQIDQILETTSVDLGATGKDNDYGAGRIDALAAVNAVSGYDHDVFVQSIISPHGVVPAGVPLTPEVRVMNIGQFTESFPVTIKIDSSGVTVFTETQNVSNLAPSGLTNVVFSSWIPGNALYQITAWTSLSTDQNPSNDTSQTTARGRVTGTQYLVWDLDPNHSSGPVIDSLLMEIGLAGKYSTSPSMADSLNTYRSVWVCLGIYSSNYVISDTSPEATSIENYLSAGGNVYMEGGDVWYFDPTAGGHDFGPTFGINALSDGSGDLSTIQGEAGTFTNGMSFSYNGENSWIDHISPGTSSAFQILKNTSPLYGVAVANDPGTYKTVGASFELAGLVDGAPPSTRQELLYQISTFFGLFTTDTFHIDVGALNIVSPSGTLPESSIVTPQATYKNFGDTTISFQAYFQIFDVTNPSTPVYSDSSTVANLAPGDTTTVTFSTWTALSGSYSAIAFTWQHLDENHSNDSVSLNFQVIQPSTGNDYLVWDLDQNNSSGPIVDSLLSALGYNGIYTTSLAYADSLSNFSSVWVFLGIFSQNYVIVEGSPEAVALENYIASGGNVYMEGGDVWYYDPMVGGHDFGPTFGINALADGSGDLSTVLGETGTFTNGMSFSYSGENNWIDHIQPTGSAFLIFENSSPTYGAGVANDNGSYKTVGTSFELGGLVDGSSPSTKLDLVQQIMNFFLQPSVIPNISVSPSSFNVSTLAGSTMDTTLWIYNNGTGNLYYSITDNATAHYMSLVHLRKSYKRPLNTNNKSSLIELPKTFDIKGNGQPVTLGFGGPDPFGYTWLDSNEPGGPTFNWIEISSTGTQIPLGDDDFATVSLPWQFPFYGVNHDSIKISSNGYLTFGTDGIDYSNDPIPNTTAPNDYIGAFWDDLNPSAGGQVYYYYDAGSNTFIVEWSGVPRWADGGSMTFQAILYPDGKILFQYLSMIGTLNSATVGIENPDGTVGLQVVYNASYVSDSLAVLVVPPNTGTDWLSESPTSGTVSPGDSAQITLTADATSLTDSTYSATITVSSNDPNQPTLSIPFILTVFALRGDANGDGVIDVQDIDFLSQYLFFNGPQPPFMDRADVNIDGQVNDLDLVALSSQLYSQLTHNTKDTRHIIKRHWEKSRHIMR